MSRHSHLPVAATRLLDNHYANRTVVLVCLVQGWRTLSVLEGEIPLQLKPIAFVLPARLAAIFFLFNIRTT